MASRFAHLIMMRRSSALRVRVLGTKNATSQFSRQPSSNTNNQRIINSIARSSSTAISNATDDPSLRRRRRRGGKTPTTTNEGQRFLPGDPSTTTPASAASGGAFAPKDTNGNLLTSQEYLSLVSLSPWVPCPDMVIKRVFEIGNATSTDVHADLGCGDGRLNFAAVGGPYHAKKSWGVDVDENILEKCRDRLGRRFVPQMNATATATAAGLSDGDDDRDGENHASSEADRLEFLQADLIQVMERQKEKYQQQLLGQADGSSSSSQDGNQSKGSSSSSDDVITQKLSQSTIITMYFVHDALQQLQPYLASILGGKDNVRVITVGYEMKGWDATWVERVLGLTIFKYDMKHVSNDPLQWRKDVVGEEKEGTSPEQTIDFDGDYADVDDESNGELAKYLRQKREQDMEELNNGLKIHHDEKLDDFAQSRSKRQAQQSSSSSSSLGRNVREQEEDGWDFDENEDPKVLMKEAEQIMAEARRGGRGKGLMAGLDDAEKQQQGKGGKKKKGANEARIAAKAKPVWKKP